MNFFESVATVGYVVTENQFVVVAENCHLACGRAGIDTEVKIFAGVFFERYPFWGDNVAVFEPKVIFVAIFK